MSSHDAALPPGAPPTAYGLAMPWTQSHSVLAAADEGFLRSAHATVAERSARTRPIHSLRLCMPFEPTGSLGVFVGSTSHMSHHMIKVRPSPFKGATDSDTFPNRIALSGHTLVVPRFRFLFQTLLLSKFHVSLSCLNQATDTIHRFDNKFSSTSFRTELPSSSFFYLIPSLKIAPVDSLHHQLTFCSSVSASRNPSN